MNINNLRLISILLLAGKALCMHARKRAYGGAFARYGGTLEEKKLFFKKSVTQLVLFIALVLIVFLGRF